MTAAAKTILIADDNDGVRTIIKLSLQFKGYSLVEAEDGAKAFAALESNPAIDLLISDIEMPMLNGLELLDKIRGDSRFAKLPVVICSAEEGTREDELLRRGANAFLGKPVRPVDLLATVGELIG
jgi:CheY-like chemotaxis protein